MSKSKPSRQSPRGSSLLMTVLVIPVILLFFLFGVYVGSQFMEEDMTIGSISDSASGEISKGLPGTNNLLRRWGDESKKYLRGAAAEMREEMRDVARMAEALVGMSPPAPLFHIVKTDTTVAAAEIGIHVAEVEDELKGLKRPMMPNSMYNHAPAIQHIFTDASIPQGHTVSGTQQQEQLKISFHAIKDSYMVGPRSLDNSNILVGVWVYLDESAQDINDMRTIFTNKKSGCENLADQYGLSMYVNAWESNDHRLYVEYGGMESGCHKLDSNGIQLHSEQWYHVAVYLGGESAYLFIDGTVVGTSLTTEEHQVQTTRPLRVGQYDDGQYPFHGQISHLAFIHCDPMWTAATIEVAVKSMMDISLVKSIKGLHALYTLTEGAEEKSESVAIESISGINGVYSFPSTMY